MKLSHFRSIPRSWRIRQAEAELMGMSDYMLKDIGLSRSGISTAVRGGQPPFDGGNPLREISLHGG